MDIKTNISGAIKGFMVVSNLIKPPLWHGHPYGAPPPAGDIAYLKLKGVI